MMSSFPGPPSQAETKAMFEWAAYEKELEASPTSGHPTVPSSIPPDLSNVCSCSAGDYAAGNVHIGPARNIGAYRSVGPYSCSALSSDDQIKLILHFGIELGANSRGTLTSNSGRRLSRCSVLIGVGQICCEAVYLLRWVSAG
jgi:hypothetical protein